MANGKRLLFLDLIRIEAIIAIVVFHLSTRFHIFPLDIEFPLFGLLWVSVGALGVYVLLFVSGAALAYTYPAERVFKDLKGFYISRLLRIYPAFWVALIFSIILMPYTFYLINWENVVLIVTGFTAFAGDWGGPLGDIFWFIGLIVSLYLVYPVLIWAINKKPIWSMVILMQISVLSTILLVYFNFMGAADLSHGVTRWFPLCSLAVFGAGIFCIRTGGYPKVFIENTSLLTFFAEISFFVYLYHYNLWGFAAINIWFYFGIVFGISYAAMIIDERIRLKIHEMETSLRGDFPNQIGKRIQAFLRF
jgi:peptidoglycan/LPS O-acetylase OafA/YrhL